FFFSSRRRHTRSKRDWSSDVCSSDLEPSGPAGIDARTPFRAQREWVRMTCSSQGSDAQPTSTWPLIRKPGVPFALASSACFASRSEERRVGKESRCGGGGGQ